MKTSAHKPLTIVAQIQFAPVMDDIDASIEVLRPLMELAFTADIVVLPELASTGYGFKDKQEAFACAEKVSESRFVNFLKSMAAKHNYLVVAGLNELDGDQLFNSSVLVDGSGVIGVYRKIHLFHRESDIFTPGNLGLPVFDTVHGKIGLLICFDWMFSEPWRVMALKGAQLVCHSANLVLPYCKNFMPTHAYVNGLAIASCNRIGEERGMAFRGESFLVDAMGNKVVQASTGQEIVWGEIDMHASLSKRIFKRNHFLNDRRVDIYGNLNVE